MKKLFSIIGLMLFLTSAVFAQKPVLKFNSDRRFRIMQFTDMHYHLNSYKSDSTLAMVRSMIIAEKPDLVVFTGDVITSSNTREAWEIFSNTIAALKTPWAVVLGNHDIEHELTGKQIFDLISKKPYSLSVNGPRNLSGNGNFILKVHSFSSPAVSAVLYFLDSHSSFRPRSDRGVYEWIEFDQVVWYRKESARLTQKNGGKPFPALAFFHIPLPEYKEVVGQSLTVGSQIEEICSPDVNTGIYFAFLESRDVMATFVGHDHNNNFIGCLRDICLVYGQSSGRQTYGSIGKGARIIEMYEGERKFDTWTLKWYDADRDNDTWVPAADRSPQNFVTYPDSFRK